MMPPFLNSLGPITDWLGGMMLGPLIKKYDAINQASSAAKVTVIAFPRSDQVCMSIFCCCKAHLNAHCQLVHLVFQQDILRISLQILPAFGLLLLIIVDGPVRRTKLLAICGRPSRVTMAMSWEVSPMQTSPWP